MGEVCCPRCGRQNAIRARFCAGCGLNLSAATGDLSIELNKYRRTGRRWLLVAVILGIAIAGWLLLRRDKHPHRLILPLDRDAVRWEGDAAPPCTLWKAALAADSSLPRRLTSDGS